MKGAQSRIRHLATAALLPALLAAAGCGSSKPASTTQATVPSTTISATASYAIPNRITAAYVQRVINALDEVDGQATRLIVEHRALVPQAVYRLKAINSDPWFTEVADTWADQLAHGLKGYRLVPGDKKDVVSRVISANSSCVFVSVLTDYSLVSTVEQSRQVNYLQMVPLPTGRDPSHYNPTPWSVKIEGYNSRGLVPGDPCAGS